MKEKLGVYLFLFLLLTWGFLLVKSVQADETDTVTATVTAEIFSVSLDNADGIAFLTIGVGSSANSTSGGVNDSTTATNIGSVPAKINVKAGNSTNWTLDTSPASETYAMEFCVTNCDVSPSWATVGVNPAYATLVASVGVGSTQIFDLQVKAPTGTTATGEQTITVTVQAVTPS